MSLLFKVIVAARCTSTHHRLAMDALRFLEGHDGQNWRDLFLKHHEAYLAGSKAPDAEFRDFKNHVIHVREHYWGGAVEAANKWYARAVDAFRHRDWEQGVYATGVLSHYYCDPIQPLHTGQTEEEGSIHRAAEWSIAKSYDELVEILELDLGGYPDVDLPSGDDWLARFVRQGAEKSNPHYEALVDHYDLDQGVKNPRLGLDDELRARLAKLIGYATVGLARILEQAFQDARVAPPTTFITLRGFFASLKMPLFWVSRKLADRRDRAEVEMIYEEVRRTGKAIVLLSEDDRTVRRLHAEDVLKVPLRTLDRRRARPTGTKHGQRSSPAELPPAAEPNAPKLRGLRTEYGEPGNHLEQQASSHAEPQKTNAGHPAAGHGERKAPKFRLSSKRRQRDFPRPQPPPRENLFNERLQTAPSKVDRSGPTALQTGRRESISPASQDEQAGYGPPEQSAGQDRRDGREFNLQLGSPVVDAPSIGAKTARRLAAVGVRTVADLLQCDPERVAPRLGKRWITPAVIRDWQSQASLVCRVPELHGHDAQILVACGITQPHQLAQIAPEKLFSNVKRFAVSPEGQRILWSGKTPDLEEVRSWIQCAASARTLRAA